MEEPTPIRPNRRLVVELNARVAHMLDDLVTAEGLNKTTLVNRAVQVYKLLVDVQAGGGMILLQEGGSDQVERLRIL